MTHRPQHAGRQAMSWLGEALLWAAAAGGAVCIVLVILAHTMGITLMMFSTGSMAPTIPTGSIAVVQQTPASEIEVGDVVTVDRAEQLPVTHRVTSVEAGASADDRTITMRGDANQQDDPHPYTVTSVRTVLWSVPGLAAFIVQLGNPLVLGGITIAAALLVGWAFWPKQEKHAADASADDRAPVTSAGAES